MMIAPPKKILLATDLNARSDRALDRSIALMRHYQARLVLLHVLEANAEPSGARRIPFFPVNRLVDPRIDGARRQLLDYLGEAGTSAQIRLEEGAPHRVIMRVAREEGCDLIVTGVARNEALGRFSLGKTTDRILRAAEAPVLVVTERVRAPYRNVVALTDLCAASKRAVEIAAAFFPDQSISALYAFAAARATAVGERDRYIEQMRAVAERDLREFIAGADLSPRQRDRMAQLVEFGDELPLLRELARLSSVDVVVVGATRRMPLLDAVFGGRVTRIISSVPCDVLIVPGGRSFAC